MVRPITSVAPPGAKGTTIVIGRDGLGPRNEGRDNRRPPAGAKPSDRPDANGSIGDFLRELFSR
jgi:hypothetical protein